MPHFTDNSLSAHQLPSQARLYLAAILSRHRLPAGALRPDLRLTVTDLAVDRDHLARYRDHFAFFPDVSPADEMPAPYGYLLTQHALLYLITRPEFPLKAMGLVHIGVRFEQTGTLAVMAGYRAELRVCHSRYCAKGLLFDITVALRADDTASEQLLITNTYLARGVKSAVTAGVSREHEQPVPSLADFKPLEMSDCDETQPLMADAGRRYASLSGDWNPIHLWPLTARLFGFKRPIAHGMALVSQAYQRLARQGITAPACSQFQFRSPCYLPGEVSWQQQGEQLALASVSPAAGAENSNLKTHLQAVIAQSRSA